MRAGFVGLVVVLVGCGGRVEDPSNDVVVTDDSALTAAPEAGDDDSRGDDGCKEGDHDGHKHHRHHWFKVLDRLDGAKDHAITIANLPPGMPDGLLKKLARLDKNGDGIVSKKEAKSAWRHRHHGDHDDDDGDRDDDDHDDH